MALTQEFLDFLTEEEKRKAGVANPNPQKNQDEKMVEALPQYTGAPIPPKEPQAEGGVARNLHEFVGQAVWGALDSAAWGTLELGETLSEGTGLTEKNAVEKYLALGAEGDWEDLSSGGKAGYVVGAGLGMLPTFGWASKTVSAGSKGLSKVFGKGALDKQNKELITDFVTKEIVDNNISRSITQGNALTSKGGKVISDIVDEGNKLKQVSNGYFNPLKAGYTTISEEALEQGVMKLGAEAVERETFGHLNKGITNVLDNYGIKAAPEEIQQISQAVLQIMKTENPTNVRHAIKALLSSSLPEKAQDFISAYATDALLVGLHGGMTAVAHNIAKFGANNTIDAKAEYDGVGKMTSDMLHHGFWGGFIGPARFIGQGKGKGSRILGDDLAGIIKRNTTSFTKMLDYSPAQKKEAVNLLYNASKGRTGILEALGITDRYFNPSNIKKMSVEELDNIIMKARDKFPSVLNEHIRSGMFRDIKESLPRMLAGTAAMNLPNIWAITSAGGNVTDVATALGTDPGEIAANLFVGMMFSKRGEKFSNRSKYWKQMSESNRYFAENIDQIKELQEGMDILNFKPAHLEAFKQLKHQGSQVEVGNVIKQQVVKDPQLREIFDIIESANVDRRQIGDKIGQLGSEAKTFKRFIIDRIMEIKQDKSLDMAQERIAIEELYKAQGMYDAILSKKRDYSPELINEISIERGDFDLMVERLSRIETKEGRPDTPAALRDMLESRARLVFESETNATVALKMGFLNDAFAALQIETRYNDRTGKLEIPQHVLDLSTDIFDFGSKGNDPALTSNFVSLMAKARGAGLLSGYDGVHQSMLPSRDQASKIRDLFDDANNKVLESIHGEGYREQGIAVANKDAAMSSDAGWAAYHIYRQDRQAKDLEFIITGKGESPNIDPASAKEVRDKILKNLVNKDITWDPIGVDNATVGELTQYFNRLKKYLGYHFPSPQAREKVERSIKQLEDIKTTLDPLIGDVFSNDRSFQRALNSSIDGFAKKLGGNNLNNRYDVRKALVELVTGGEFGSYDPRTSEVKLPDSRSVLDELNSKFGTDSKKIDHYMEFYNELVGELGASQQQGFVKLERMQRHDKAVDWTIVLENARRASDMQNYQMVLNGEVGNAVRDYSSISRTAVSKKMVDSKGEQKLVDLLTGLDKATISLKAKYEAAMAEGNTVVLHALAKQTHKLHDSISELQNNRDIDGPIAEAQTRVINDIINKIEYSRDVKAFDRHLNEKISDSFVDRQSARTAGEKPRITLNQFINKYSLDNSFANRMLKAATLSYNSRNAQNSELLIDVDRIFFDSNGKKSFGQANFDINRANIKDFIRPWSEKLQDRMQSRHERDGDIRVPTLDEIAIDVKQSFVDPLLNSRIIKQLEYNDGVGTITDSRLVNWMDHGLTGLLDGMNLWDNAYLLKEGGKIGGKRINTFGSKDMDIIDSKLNNADFIMNIENMVGHLSEGEALGFKGTVKGDMYLRVPMDESTNLIVRFNQDTKKRIKGAFAENTALSNAFDSIVGNTPGHARFKKMVNSKTLNADQAKQILLHARLMRAFPQEVKAMYENKDLWSSSTGVDYQASRTADLWKRLKMNQTKSGIIPNPGTVKSAMELMTSINSPFFQAVQKRASNVIKADGTGKVKVLTVNDGNSSKYNIYERYVDLATKKWTEEGMPESMVEHYTNQARDNYKEITDAVTYVGLDPMVAFSGIMGSRAEHFTFDGAGDINGVKFAIKPSVAHSNILPTGGHEVYYNKTAFHYDPVMAQLMKELGVDMLAFKSGNKVNSFSPDKGLGSDRYMIDKDTDLLSPFGEKMDLVDKNGAKFNNQNPDHIVELPLESILLKNMALDHLPALSQSMGVHSHHDNGIWEWGGMEGRFSAAKDAWADVFNNPYKSTDIARRTSNFFAKDGNQSALNSGLDFWLNAGGTGDAMFIRKQLEQQMVSYYLNGGSIATGEAARGNNNIMIPERGNFNQPFKYGDRQYIYGESMPSFAEGAQELSFFGRSDGTHANVGAFIIKQSARRGWTEKTAFDPVADKESFQPVDRDQAGNSYEITKNAEYVIYKVDGNARVAVEGYELLKSGELVSENGHKTPETLNAKSLKEVRRKHREELIGELDKLEALKGDGKLTYSQAMEAIVREDLFNITNEQISSNSTNGFEFTVGKEIGINPKYQYPGGQSLYVAHNNITGRYEILRKNTNGEFIKETDSKGLKIALANIRQAQTKGTRFLGASDLRMPSNGTDNVITKSRGQFQIDPKTGEIYFEASLSESMGPVKMMNYTDVDRRQDADFDFDKSASYTAVHGKFLKNALGTSGHEQIADNLTIDSINSIVQTEIQNIDFTKPGDYARVKDQLADVNKFRGRVVKAHQVATYLVNAFGDYRGTNRKQTGGETVVGEINLGMGLGLGEIILRNPGEITSNKTFVRALVKKFLDYYKNPPERMDSFDAQKEVVKEIYFGTDGMFTVRPIDPLKARTPESAAQIAEGFYNSSNARVLKDYMMDNLINPLSKYISYNKGEVSSAEGVMKATLQDFAFAYNNTRRSLTTVPSYSKKPDMNLRNPGDFNIQQGKDRLWDYINNESRAPFDRGMKSLHDIHSSRSGHKMDITNPTTELIESAVNSGFDAAMVNNWMNNNLNKVYRHYVKNQAKVIELKELGTSIEAIERQMFQIESFNKKTYSDSPEYKALSEKLIAMKNAEASLNAIVSTFDKENTFQIRFPNKDGSTIKEGFYQNRGDVPIVVYNRKGKERVVSEVIQPGDRNRFNLQDNSVGVMNGRRFKVVDGGEYRDSKASFNVFGGLIKYRDGSTMPITEKLYVDSQVNKFVAKVMENNAKYPDRPGMDRMKYGEKSIETEALLNNALLKLDGPEQRKAFLFKLLTPKVDQNVIAITSSSDLPGSHTTFDYAFKKNYWEPNVYKYLAGKASGSRFQDTNSIISKAEAQGLIDLVTKMKTVEMYKLYNPTYHINNLSPELSTSKATNSDLDIVSGRLNESFLNKVNAADIHNSTIVNNFLDWMTGKRMMTPSELNAITNEFVNKHGFNPADMYLNQRFSIDGAGNKTPYGETNLGQTVKGYEKFSRSDKFGQPGSRLTESPLDYVGNKIKNRNCK